MKLKDFKHIKNLLIISTSEKPSLESYRLNISAKKLLYTLIIYSFLVFMLGFFLLNILEVNRIFGSATPYTQDEEHERLIELNMKVDFLSKEIEKLKSTNEKLRYAIILADSNLLVPQKDSSHFGKSLKKKTTGSLFGVFQMLIKNFFSHSEKSIDFILPLNGFISQGFKPQDGHYGIDIVAKIGTPIYAAGNGYVLFSDYTSDDGFMIIIMHSNEYISIYKHCSILIKQKKEKVIQGELIALSGDTGRNSHGAHLHFELWKKNKPVNPLNYLIN
jgi:murein DD-endopeptidase MepM/ murein hydrolase activator NlpD